MVNFNKLNLLLILPLIGLLLTELNEIALSEQNKSDFFQNTNIYISQSRLSDNKKIAEKLEPNLAIVIKQGRKNPLRVAFHLKVENIPVAYRGNNREEHREHLINLRTRYAEIQKPLVDELNALKQPVIYQSEYSAVVFALVTPEVIQQMALRNDVERVYLEYDGYNSSKPPQQHQNISRPAYVWEVLPSEKSIQSSVDSINVVLSFVQEPIQVKLDSFQLILNGIDVTSQTQIGGIRNYPPGRLEMNYVVPHLKPGKHNAEIGFRARDGKRYSYKWSFSLR